MKFSQDLIDLARDFKRMGIDWEPEVGHYVYDANGEVKPTSPFQPGVYFLLNYDCFMDRVHGVERFKEIMTWLPTWEHARQILRSLGVADSVVCTELENAKAIQQGNELRVLYRLIHRELVQSPQPATPPADAAQSSQVTS